MEREDRSLIMELNDLQKVIVETEEPKVVVIASAAAGKTAVLTERLKFLLKKGVDPSKIVCITFTNAASEELRNRVGNYPSLFISFHCFEMILHFCRDQSIPTYIRIV